MSPAAPRVAVVGIHGYGGSHVFHLHELAQQGRARLVGLVDPLPGAVTRDGATLGADELPQTFPSLPELLAHAEVDIVVIATPIHTHAELARIALAAGAHVLLEKPPVSSLAEFSALLQAQSASGRAVQVGFQSLGSHALRALRSSMDAGELGTIEAIGASGSWMRPLAYWHRARWAGRRSLDGRPVVDGAVANPFAHAVMSSLWLARRFRPESVGFIEAELFQASGIEADDTATVRIGGAGAGAIPITCAFTLAGPREDLPVITVRGSRATARLHYTEDVLELGGETRRLGRADLLENLIEHIAGGAELLAPFELTGSFMAVLEAVMRAPVRRIGEPYVRWAGEGENAHPVVSGIDGTVAAAAVDGRLFGELGVAWAQ
ncbi:MAG TPA: Gfo/Idh/MocA family oxidoreductase [Gryllotalpicola sp.]